MGTAVVDGLRQTDHIGLGVIVIGEISADALDTHVVNAVAPQDLLCGLGTGQSPLGGAFVVFLKGGIDPTACP